MQFHENGWSNSYNIFRTQSTPRSVVRADSVVYDTQRTIKVVFDRASHCYAAAKMIYAGNHSVGCYLSMFSYSRELVV